MTIVNRRKSFLIGVSEYLHYNIDAVEIGVLDGDFSQLILDILKPYSLVLVDPFEENEETYPDGLKTAYSTQSNYDKVFKRFENEIELFRVYIDKNYSHNAVDKYEHDVFDFIYHDGSHLYEDLKRDLNEWFPKLTENGLMCGHDYGGIFPGVKQAVDEFCTEHNFEMIIYNENSGDYALKRK